MTLVMACTFLALNMSRDQFKKWHEEHTAKTDAVDQRVCLLCGAVGDGSPNGPSRYFTLGSVDS